MPRNHGSNPVNTPLHPALQKIGADRATHHVFLCLGPDCCPSATGEESWEYLKKRIHELRLPVLRTKAGCLRVCGSGPVMVVYPEGIWYESMSPERLERVIQQHLVHGEPVLEWTLGIHPLKGHRP